MAKHTQTIRRLLLTNCLSVFDHFVGLTREGLDILCLPPGSISNAATTLSKDYTYNAESNGRSIVIDRRNSVRDRQKALFNDHNGCQYLDVTTTFNNLDFILCNRQVKQSKFTTGTMHKQLGLTKLSVLT